MVHDRSCQTYTGQERFLPMVMSVLERGSQMILTYLYLSAKCSKIQRRLRMGKSKRGRASSSLYTPGSLGLK